MTLIKTVNTVYFNTIVNNISILLITIILVSNNLVFNYIYKTILIIFSRYLCYKCLIM